MQETAQITTALKYLPWGKHVALLTDGRFSGFSSGACIGHIGPEALQRRPDRPRADDDLIEIVIDRGDALSGSINLVGVARRALLRPTNVRALLATRDPHPALRAARIAARRHAAVGGAAARERRHVGGLRVRRRSHRRAARRGRTRDGTSDSGAPAATTSDHSRLTGAGR